LPVLAGPFWAPRRNFGHEPQRRNLERARLWRDGLERLNSKHKTEGLAGQTAKGCPYVA